MQWLMQVSVRPPFDEYGLYDNFIAFLKLRRNYMKIPLVID